MFGHVLRGSRDKTIDWNRSFDEKLEQKLSRLDKMPKYLKRGVPYGNNVVAIINHGDSGQEKFYGLPVLTPQGEKHIANLQRTELIAEVNKELTYGANLVGDAGDIFYAQLGAAETPTNDFKMHELGAGGQTTAVAKGDDRGDLKGNIAGTQKNTPAGYPQSNDTDTDNTGAAADVTTWLVSYTTSDFNNTDIQGGIITNTGPATAEPILTRYIITAFAKTATDTLKIFVNHTANGV